jgi:hypothetical protein
MYHLKLKIFGNERLGRISFIHLKRTVANMTQLLVGLNNSSYMDLQQHTDANKSSTAYDYHAIRIQGKLVMTME